MQHKLTEKAINAALKQDWQQAIKINLQILEESPQDIPTLNRLAKAYKEVGNNQKSIITYKKVIAIDPYNTIAQKNHQALSNSHQGQNGSTDKLITNFVEEPGKTKCVTLTRLANPEITTNLQPGQPVKLVPKSYIINVYTTNNTRIGAISDKDSFTLKKCISQGNQYQAAIKSTNDSKISIFIRETYRCPELEHSPTFN